MSKKNRRSESHPMTDTMQLEEAAESFEPMTDALPEEYVPAEAEEYSAEAQNVGQQYAKAEKVLSVLTSVLSCLLILGSMVFWWHFGSRLSICPLAVNDYQIYNVMLIGCSVVPLAGVVIQALRRSPASSEGWMINMCLSGVVTAIIATVYSLTALDYALDFHRALAILCFSVSGCALPAAVYTVLYWLVGRLTDSVRQASARDREAVYGSVIDQCEGRF